MGETTSDKSTIAAAEGGSAGVGLEGSPAECVSVAFSFSYTEQGCVATVHVARLRVKSTRSKVGRREPGSRMSSAGAEVGRTKDWKKEAAARKCWRWDGVRKVAVVGPRDLSPAVTRLSWRRPGVRLIIREPSPSVEGKMKTTAAAAPREALKAPPLRINFREEIHRS